MVSSRMGWASEQRVSPVDRPVVLEAYTDPNVPPLPPHITFEQAKSYLSALFKGDPDRKGIVSQSIRELAGNLMPHKD